MILGDFDPRCYRPPRPTRKAAAFQLRDLGAFDTRPHAEIFRTRPSRPGRCTSGATKDCPSFSVCLSQEKITEPSLSCRRPSGSIYSRCQSRDDTHPRASCRRWRRTAPAPGCRRVQETTIVSPTALIFVLSEKTSETVLPQRKINRHLGVVYNPPDVLGEFYLRRKLSRSVDAVDLRE